MNLKSLMHRRNRLPLALAVATCLALLWLWQVTLPQLDKQSRSLDTRRVELRQRQQAAAMLTYQPLIEKLQHPLPVAADIITRVRKISGALDLTDTSYTLSQQLPLEYSGTALVTRRLSISLPNGDAATALAFWQDLRQSLPCELRLTSLNSEGASTRLELELLGTPS